MISRFLDFLKGTISLALLLGLLVGVPVLLLVVVGYPLPTEQPSIEVIRAHLEAGDIPDEFIIKALAIVVWIVWAQLAVAVVAEGLAMVRGRVARRAPVLPGMQLVAGKLVASSLLIVSAFLPNRAATAAPLVPISATEVAFDAGSGAPPIGPGGPAGPLAEISRNGLIAGPAGAAGTGAGVTASVAVGGYQTRSGDSWWDMAERLLGDGMRWSELRDLNSGRTMLTGEVISDQTVDVVEGWHLAVPADARADLLTVANDTAAPPEATGTGASGTAASDNGAEGPIEDSGGVEVPSSSPLIEAIKPFSLVYEGPTDADVPGRSVPYQVVDGDTLWDIADRHLGDPFRWPEIFENSTDLKQTFGRTISDPNLIWPDSIVLLPADATDVPAPDAELVTEVLGPVDPAAFDADDMVVLRPEDLRQAVAAAEGTAAGDPPPDGPPDRGEPTWSVEDSSQGPEVFEELGRFFTSPPGVAVGVGGTMVATGLLDLLRRSRRLRLTEAGPGTIPKSPPVDLVDIETVLRNSSADRETISVHRIIASLADRPIVAGEPTPAPEIIRIGAERVEVIQDGQDPDLPSPWLPATNDAIETLGGRSIAVLPAEFFPVDPEPVDGSTLAAPACVTIGGGLLANLESIGVMAIAGSVDATAGLVRSMVHELATGPARRSLDIRISDRLPGADLHDHVRCGPLDGLAGELESWFEDVDLGMSAAAGFSPYALRASGDGRSIPAPKIIFADAEDASMLESVLTRARGRTTPLAVVFTGAIDANPTMPVVTVEIAGPVTTVLPHGVVAASQHLETDLVLGAEALITHARQAPMVHRDDDQATILPNIDHRTDPAQAPTEETPEHDIVTERPSVDEEVTDRADEADSGILIRVLGAVEFDGGPDDLTEEERSIVTFLALVGPSTDEQLKAAVWPGQAISDERFTTVIDHLADRLGLLFPRAADGRHRVRSVITDLGSARRWLAQATTMSDERSRNLTELALSEVRGAPFEGVDPRYWQWVEDHQLAVSTQACSLLIDACFDLCDDAYKAGDLALASWACDVASLIDPIHETIAIRQVQLLGVSGRDDEAADLVDRWEAGYTRITDRSAPRGPRSALRPREVVSPNVG